jgi:hypothetical protein
MRSMELRYKKNKVKKERRPECSVMISPRQAAVGLCRAVTDGPAGCSKVQFVVERLTACGSFDNQFHPFSIESRRAELPATLNGFEHGFSPDMLLLSGECKVG